MEHALRNTHLSEEAVQVSVVITLLHAAKFSDGHRTPLARAWSPSRSHLNITGVGGEGRSVEAQTFNQTEVSAKVHFQRTF